MTDEAPIDQLRIQWEAAKREAEIEVRALRAEIEHLKAYAKHERSLGAEGPMIELTSARQEIERLKEDVHLANGTADLAMQHRDVAEAEIKQLHSLLFRLRNYIAGEHTLDRPKDAMLELIDTAIKDTKP